MVKLARFLDGAMTLSIAMVFVITSIKVFLS